MPDQVFMTKMPLTNYPVCWNTLLRSTMGNKTWSWSILSTCCGELIIKFIVRSKKENIVDNDVFAGSKCEGRKNVINSFFHKDTITCFRFLQGHPFPKTLKMSTFLVCEIEKVQETITRNPCSLLFYCEKSRALSKVFSKKCPYVFRK